VPNNWWVVSTEFNNVGVIHGMEGTLSIFVNLSFGVQGAPGSDPEDGHRFIYQCATRAFFGHINNVFAARTATRSRVVSRRF